MDDTHSKPAKPPALSTDFSGGTPLRSAFAGQPDFDAALYWDYIDGLEASDAEKSAVLRTLWDLMARFVELGFGVDPVQQLMPSLACAAEEASRDAGADEIKQGITPAVNPSKQEDDHE